MRPTRRRSLFALAAVVALFGASCSDDDTTTTPGDTDVQTEGEAKTGGVLVDLQNFSGAAPEHLDPNLVSSIQESQPGQLMWDTLTETDPKTSKLINNVASKVEHNDDFTVWTFTVKKGLLFSNGSKVLPSSFAFSWNRLVHPALASQVSYHATDNLKIKGAAEVADGSATEMSGLVADDEAMTLTMTLEEPLNFADAIVSHLAFAPLDPKDVLKGETDVAKTVGYETGIMIGNGPYMMKEAHKPNDSVTLVRNPKYGGGPNKHAPYIDEIVFKEFADQEVAFTSFESGAGDTGYIPQARFAEAKAKYAGRISDKPFLGLYYWGFNNNDKVVGGPENLKLRQAMTAAIDKDQMIEKVYNGSRKVATGIAMPGIPGYKAGLDKIPNRDLAAAKKYLAEWEAETGKKAADLAPIKLNFGIGLGHSDNATIIQANLAELGIKSTLDGRDGTTYFSQMRKSEGQFLRSGWIADYVSYDNMLFPLFGSSQAGTGDNLVQLKSPEFDALITKARQADSDADAAKAYQEAEDYVLNKQRQIVPLNWYAGAVVWSERLHNVIQSPTDFFIYDEMWLDQA